MTKRTGGKPPSRKRHFVPLALAAVVCFVVLWDIETRSEFCVLCGKGRGVVALRLPHLDISQEEYGKPLSDALEPLVHSGGVGHVWHVYRGGSLLSWPVRAVDSLRHWREYSIVFVWGRTSAPVQAASYWDQELAVAVGQYFLGGCVGAGVDSDRAEELLLQLRITFPPFVFAGMDPPDRNDWNKARHLAGLSELQPSQMGGLIEGAFRQAVAHQEAEHPAATNSVD